MATDPREGSVEQPVGRSEKEVAADAARTKMLGMVTVVLVVVGLVLLVGCYLTQDEGEDVGGLPLVLGIGAVAAGGVGAATGLAAQMLSVNVTQRFVVIIAAVAAAGVAMLGLGQVL